MNAERLLQHYEQIAYAPDAIARLRRFILDLAVRGKLVPQSFGDEPASELLKRIAEEKARLLKAGEIRTPKPFSAVVDVPFSIPSNWSWTQIAEIGIISPRNDAPDALEASFVPMPLIAAEYGVVNGHEVRTWGEIKKGYTHFAEGDVGLAKITPCFENGKSTVFRNLTGGIGSGTTELHVVRPLLVVADYILLFWKSPHFIETGIPKMTGTAGQKRVPTDYFAYSPFPLPPLDEQHRIVAKVDELMALCDELEAARTERETKRDRLTAASLARLNTPDPETFRDAARFALDALPALTARPDQIKQLRQTILNLAVRGKLVPQDPSDEPAGELLKRISSEKKRLMAEKGIRGQKPALPAENFELDTDIPATWQHVYLQDIAYQITDGTHLTPKYTETGKPFLSAQNVKPFRFMPGKHRFVSEQDFDSYRANRRPERGDILLTRVGAGIGEAAVLDSDFEFAFYVSLCLIKVPTSCINVEYLVLWLNSPEGRDSSSSRTYGKGASQGNLNLGLIRTFKIPLPPLAEQNRIVATVDELMALCDQLETSLASADETRKKLLDTLLAEALAPVDADALQEAAE
ncbi:restriction endonuclease subunit S [Ciceribacter sp. L1K22]|uniref:restriction endonuclease subunit S n=1 Tax=Ciceribacter sp. L1K22 TaxID=2820275 RepID=UPI001ABE8E7A|nr:restriction endonuclease subunit S [Ciceribacter sp. L1K22]MBO3762572.1 restriction endonuclease subunit S [Ciceribacter sp. L1K22]